MPSSVTPRDRPSARPTVAVILVAAGRGSRAASAGGPPKQYRQLHGKPVIARTISAFLDHQGIDRILAVIHPDDLELYNAAVAGIDDPRLLPPVPGGADRQASCLAGLAVLDTEAPDYVLIHDAVRPFIRSDAINRVIDALAHEVAVLCGVPVIDTVKRADAEGYVEETVPREGLWRAATPQGFRYAEIAAAHRALAARGISGVTDDAAVAELAGHRVLLVDGGADNIKLTTAEDFHMAEQRIAAEAFLACPDVRVGTGYDVHVLEPGDGVTLCGVFIPHNQRLKGHSDADVALHALTDAILGALGDGDIGKHFPPSDERWRDAASMLFLKDAVRRITERGGFLAHCDVTLIAEAPKVGPHREAMRAAIAETCGISIDRVGVKATTNEGLGFAGRREGIAAIATATVRLPLVG
ncbi:bifunctional 2-C-methyl-D-erythritol 4-phosphate cytidylyltransferase/2-C-methyl-D-erythritol 2,4-cyclodiphosphate synthase [Pleomorphomonas diazotrophica]|uniref:Bifunctional enzyme IspD/IspF n=1 Tax=Pleomorphomonas diazotrophica TaxID=1166257 RepID=A0A1I4QYL3_9HYPH|nr:bifunctional 2-C-methyl-D-erythritol 4-phosphate cytidylyltransferase/2-C-methyl-D-erythritol 2,4-cyclodiphosphate synthase [Pleomorphomonas diazotrophica]PKR90347.1 bifunctional 2-C-methyl-D-erythritol 4-phosphate cytidylyltransferase/2-C-methyl-D-erythritol 2,4-cyclodiphosphate synthase [Pleomorphomonas diazotrophica]SFM44810.1 2-C-methyl-D-erythritol 2,4-cyclodiphosphate synthase [Pleomorphomonas diazotrophica]